MDSQGLIARQAETEYSTVPTPLMQQGNFSELGATLKSSPVAGQGGCINNNIIAVSCKKQSWKISAASTEVPAALAEDKPVDARLTVTVSDDAPFTRPYFSRPDIEQSYYDIYDEESLNRPFAPYPLAGWAEFSYNGVPIRIGQTVQTIKRVTGEGAVFEPLAVGPAIGVSISPRAGIVPLDTRSFNVTTVIHSNVKGPAEGMVQLALPEGWKSEPSSAKFATSEDGQDQSVTFLVTPANLAQKPSQRYLKF